MKNTTIGILCAGDDELAPFLPWIEHCQISERAMLKFYCRQLEGFPVTTLFSGVCRVNAAIAAQILIDTYHCDVMINAGTAGAIQSGLNIFDTVVSTATAYHDVSADILTDFHPWLSSLYIEADPHLLTLARHAAKQVSYPVVFGRTVTGESFIDDKEKHRILQDFAPLSVDMESAGIAHVCYVNKIPFLAVRTLTDQADHSAPELFEKNCQRASAQSADFVRQMLRLWATHGA